MTGGIEHVRRCGCPDGLPHIQAGKPIGSSQQKPGAIRRFRTRCACANGTRELCERCPRQQRKTPAHPPVTLIPLHVQPAELPPRFVAVIHPQCGAYGRRGARSIQESAGPAPNERSGLNRPQWTDRHVNTELQQLLRYGRQIHLDRFAWSFDKERLVFPPHHEQHEGTDRILHAGVRSAKRYESFLTPRSQCESATALQPSKSTAKNCVSIPDRDPRLGAEIIVESSAHPDRTLVRPPYDRVERD